MFYEMTERDAQLLGQLRELVALAGIVWRGRRVYFDEFYGGRYIAVWWLPFVKNDEERTYVVPLDTVADEAHLREAIRRMEAEIQEAAA